MNSLSGPRLDPDHYPSSSRKRHSTWDPSLEGSVYDAENGQLDTNEVFIDVDGFAEEEAQPALSTESWGVSGLAVNKRRGAGWSQLKPWTLVGGGLSLTTLRRACMWRSASWRSVRRCKGAFAVLIPCLGMTTMAATIYLACATRFQCQRQYPTLSYAAEFYPEGYVFRYGMSAVALCISITIYYYNAHARGFLRSRRAKKCSSAINLMLLLQLFTGEVSAVSLCLLALLDMKRFHFWHVLFTCIFFASAWVAIFGTHRLRTRIRRQYCASRVPDPRMARIRPWYILGGAFLTLGLLSTALCILYHTILFGLMFMCVNRIWPNPFRFTSSQEGFAELVAICCQLLYMGTLWPDVGIHRKTERRRRASASHTMSASHERIEYAPVAALPMQEELPPSGEYVVGLMDKPRSDRRVSNGTAGIIAASLEAAGHSAAVGPDAERVLFVNMDRI